MKAEHEADRHNSNSKTVSPGGPIHSNPMIFFPVIKNASIELFSLCDYMSGDYMLPSDHLF